MDIELCKLCCASMCEEAISHTIDQSSSVVRIENLPISIPTMENFSENDVKRVNSFISTYSCSAKSSNTKLNQKLFQKMLLKISQIEYDTQLLSLLHSINYVSLRQVRGPKKSRMSRQMGS